MKRSSSSRKRALSVERVLAEFKTSSEADPVSVAPRLTCMILAAASWVSLGDVLNVARDFLGCRALLRTAPVIVDAMSRDLGDRARRSP